MKEFLHDLRAQLDYVSLPNLASFGKAHSKSASAKFNENAKFKPWIEPKCVWRPGSARTRWGS